MQEREAVTACKRVEELFEKSEEKYRQIFSLTPEAIILIDNENGQIVEVNEAASSFYGYCREELLAMKNTDLSAEPEKTRQATNNGLAHVPLRWHRRKNGTIFPVEITANHLTWKERDAHIAVIRDKTKRLKAEKALMESEQRYRDIFEYASDCIFLIDVIGESKFKYIMFNPAEERSVGLKSEQISEKLVEEVFDQELANVLINNYRICCEKGETIRYEEELELRIGRTCF